MMTSAYKTLPLIAAGVAAAMALPASAFASMPSTPQSGRIDTLPTGMYECSLPGDASGPAWRPIPDRNFRIVNASSYEARGERGVYLLRGKELTFTRGPLKGKMLQRVSRRTLRERDADGTLGRLRCVRSGRAD